MASPKRVLPFLNHLRSRIAETGVSQREIEKRIGMSERYLSKLLNGATRLTVEHTLTILDAAGIDVEEFFREVALRYRAVPKKLTEEQHQELLDSLMPAVDKLVRSVLGGGEAPEEPFEETASETASG